MVDGVIEASLCCQEIAEVVVGLHVIGLIPEGEAQASLCLVPVAVVRQDAAEIGQGLGVSGMNVQCPTIMLDGFCDLTPACVDHAQVVVGDPAIGVAGKRVIPKAF